MVDAQMSNGENDSWGVEKQNGPACQNNHHEDANCEALLPTEK